MSAKKPIIEITNLYHTYNQDTKDKAVTALNGINLTIYEGEYVVILGHNGCGKSTLAKHLNGLLLPTQGDVMVKGLNTKEKSNLRPIRSTIGMVFQVPDNQFVATIVEEDVAFGPENLGIPRDQLLKNVDWALERTGMVSHRFRAPHLLSGGQKQRVCIAGVLAMRPRVLALDEATAMLDPQGRNEVLKVVQDLNDNDGVTVIAITHHMEEALEADRVIVMHQGQIVLQGTPQEVFSQEGRLHELKLELPQAVQLAQKFGVHDAFTVEQVTDALRNRKLSLAEKTRVVTNSKDLGTTPSITVKNLEHFYMKNTPLEVQALFDVNFDVRKGEILGIVGHTGSGKSSAVQHLNALYRPDGGDVLVLGMDTSDPKLDAKQVRRRVGLVFQSPEDQLFEQYVGDDIAYGPRNIGIAKEEIRERVRDAMLMVGLDFEQFKDRITFSLSGGQMRRVAIAGVLALHPEILVLDEPTAGLDPQGRTQLWETLLRLRLERNMTLVVISHNMEDLARICDRIVVFGGGRTLMQAPTREVFAKSDELAKLSLDVPAVTEISHKLGLGTALKLEEINE